MSAFLRLRRTHSDQNQQAQGIEVGLVAKLAGHASAVVTLGRHTQAVRGGKDALSALEAAYENKAKGRELA